MEGTHHVKKGMELARDIAWQALALAEPAEVAGRCDADWNADARAWSLAYLDATVSVSPAARTASATPSSLTLMEEVLVLRYLCQCDGSLPTWDWMSFRELPGGRLYFGPFFGRTARPLVARFSQDAEGFRAAAAARAGEPLEFRDASFRFRVLPRFWLGIVLHVGDDEFPAEVTILFDRSVQQFTTEDCAAAAQVLCRRLLRAFPRP